MADALWIFIMAAIIIGLPYAYSKKGIHYCIGIAYLLGILIFGRLFYLHQGADAVLSSIVFSAQLFTFGVDGRDLVEIIRSIEGSISIPHLVCIWTAFLICPVLSVSVVLSYVKKGLDRITLITRFWKEIYIFTEQNENALTLSKDILAKNKKAVVVFSGTNSTDISARTLCVSYSPYQVVKLLNKTNDISVCFNDSDSGLLLDRLTEYLSMPRTEKTKIYSFTDNKVAHEVIDGIKKEQKDIFLKIISPNALLVREILWDYPLYIRAKSKKTLHVTVLGVGDFGGYFAMNTLWCGILPDGKLQLNLVDMDREENILRRVSDNLREEDFDMEIFRENVNTNTFFKRISQTRLAESDYILVATGNDDLNISVARKIKLHFARLHKNPFVMTIVKNQSRYHVMKETLKKDDIVVVGGTEHVYSYENMFRDRFFPGAFAVFKLVEETYGNTPTEKDFYAQRQIDILSSYANAIHSKYKLYAIAQGEDFGAESIGRRLSENLEKVVESEHNRWVAYEILKGYVGVKEEDLEAFLENNKTTEKMHKNEILKMHACITSLENVKKLDAFIYEKYGISPKLAEIDRLIAEHTWQIWQKQAGD